MFLIELMEIHILGTPWRNMLVELPMMDEWMYHKAKCKMSVMTFNGIIRFFYTLKKGNDII